MTSILLAATVLMSGNPAQDADRPVQLIEGIKLRDEAGKDSGLILLLQPRLETPKKAPKYPDWEFEWLTAGYVPRDKPSPGRHLRFQTFSQVRRPKDDPATRATQMLLRLWSYNDKKLGLDHSEAFNNKIVDVYLAYGGPAGGEQLFGEDSVFDPRSGRTSTLKVNTIYVYQITTFTNPVEMAREVAHEYGHAVLPPIGPFKKPEDWANGFLGEMLYMRWLRDDLAADKLKPDDAMGATVMGLTGYLQKNVDPLVLRVAEYGPDFVALKQDGPAAMNAYLGLALYAEQILPSKAFSRSLALTASMKPLDYATSVVEAAEEQANWTVRVPLELRGKRIWIPVGEGKLESGKALARRGDWVYIEAGKTPIKIRNARLDGS